MKIESKQALRYRFCFLFLFSICFQEFSHVSPFSFIYQHLKVANGGCFSLLQCVYFWLVECILLLHGWVLLLLSEFLLLCSCGFAIVGGYKLWVVLVLCSVIAKGRSWYMLWSMWVLCAHSSNLGTKIQFLSVVVVGKLEGIGQKVSQIVWCVRATSYW